MDRFYRFKQRNKAFTDWNIEVKSYPKCRLDKSQIEDILKS